MRKLIFFEREPRLFEKFDPTISLFNLRKNLWDMDQTKFNF